MANPTEFSEQEIWYRIFDASDNKICVNTPNTQQLQERPTVQKVLNLVFDEINNRLGTQ